jgi:tetratricopeptide (TPR) repeat protein
MASKASSVNAQLGNSISGYVFGINRTPLPDVAVELMDEFSRTTGRTRTNGSGRYSFTGLAAGKWKVRVLPYGTDYDEQEQEVEIISFSGTTSRGAPRMSGSSMEQKDFALRLRKGVDPASAGVVFAQNIPENARKLYNQAIADFAEKKEKEAIAGLKAAIEAFPDYFDALDRLGTEYLRLGHFEAAKILLGMAVAQNSRSYRSLYGLAYSLYSLKEYTEASKIVAKAIEANASMPEAWVLSGTLMRYDKRYDEAEKRLLKGRDLAKDSDPQIHWELALVYDKMSRYADAAKELKLFLKSQPNAKDSENIKKVIANFEQKAAGQ